MFVANISSIRQYSYIESFYNFSHFVMVPNGIPIVLVSLQSFFFSCIVCTHSNRNICTISKDWNLFPLICTVRCSRLMGFLFDVFFRRVFNGDFVWHGRNTVIYRQFFFFHSLSKWSIWSIEFSSSTQRWMKTRLQKEVIEFELIERQCDEK